jgi:FlaA1/EpsC-like NDP-sugar epimerase
MKKLKFNTYKLLLGFIDAGIINFSAFLAFIIRFDGSIPPGYLNSYLLTALPVTLIFLTVFFVFGLYNQIWTYASISALLSIIYAVSIGSTLAFAFSFFMGGIRYPYSVVIISWLLNLLLIGGSRFIWRISREKIFGAKIGNGQVKVLIVGAGDAGEMILRDILRAKSGYHPVGLVDDNPTKIGMRIHGVEVLGRSKDIPALVKEMKASEVIIALPTASGEKIRKIVSICQKAKVKSKTLPPIYELIDGKVSINSIREVNEEDLLNREPIKFNFEEIQSSLEGKIILVTGAGGSIGSELCRQISKCSPRQLILLGHGENSIYHIDIELREDEPNYELIPVIANVQDKDRIEEVMERFRPDIVFHAAAYKHVWLMEQNPEEAYKNNVLGTKNVAEASLKYEVDLFVLISTDKAVNPVSVMGTSKREAELLILGLQDKGKTKFMATRFGNVMNSRGSVIPLFKRQIALGKSLTVTDPNVVRFFMTIPEAVQLVIRSALMGKGGEIFVLDMGEPIKIVNLAKELVSLSGMELNKDVEIQFTGLKPGEKLTEQLSYEDEELQPTSNKNILVVKRKKNLQHKMCYN